MNQPPYPPAPPPYPPQQPWQQQPQQPWQQPQQQWQQPPMMPPPVDPLKAPLQMVMGGLAVSLLPSLLSLAANLGGLYFFYFGPLRYLVLLISLAADGLLLAGAVLIVQRKLAGYNLAQVAAGLFGVGLLFTLVQSSNAMMRSTLGRGDYSFFSFSSILGFASVLADAGALALLALALQQLGRVRGRAIDTIVFLLIGVECLRVLVSMLLGFPFGGLLPFYAIGMNVHRILPLLMTLLGIGARTALLFSAKGIADASQMAGAGVGFGVGVPGAPGAQEGSFVLGFLAGFFGGCIGAVLVLAIAKGAKTKRGAGIGFSCQVVFGIIVRAAAR